MRKLIFSLLISLLVTSLACSQTHKSQNLNLDFEQNEGGYPKKWGKFGSDSYKIYLDSLQPKNGRYSVVIENASDSAGFKALSLVLPDNYKGKSIRLSGYIKTENVRDGYAGLWMRIDPVVGFDNMSNRGITGTTDWKEYEITLPLSPEKTKKIFIGGLLAGKGKMWLDDLQVTIDGITIDDPKLELWGSNADRDREFDNGSNIVIPQLNNQDIDNLELLGRVWGFIKYYHPDIAKGEYNWDFELFRILPDYLKVKNNSERDEVIEKWIKKYGSLATCTTCKKTANDAIIKPDLAWIDRSNISGNLKTALKDIYNNRNQGEHYYISLYPGVGNPNFKNEKLYNDMPYSDAGFRLLALYKYWNMIQYFFPYKNLTDQDWNSVLKEYVPIFVEAKDELAYELAITRLIGEVNDSHANVMSGDDKLQLLRGYKFAPFEVKFIENKLVVTDYYNPDLVEKSKLKLGDIITHINGKAIESIIDSLRPYYGASNEAGMRRAIAYNALRSSEEQIDIGFTSSGKQQQTRLQLYNSNDSGVKTWYQMKKKNPTYKLLADSIGYFTLANVTHADVSKLKDTLGNLKGLVIDIRNYPHQFVALQLASLFVSNQTEFVKCSIGNINNPGEFRFRQGAIIEPAKHYYYDTNRKPFNGKIVVLVNEYTQSQAEYTTMALRAVPNSFVVGSNTSGADGNFSDINLPGGIKTGITGIGVYYPDGKETQRIGIVPDIVVKPTIEGIKKGKDEVLEKAIELINQ